MANTFELIASSTVGSGGAASIDFTSIASTYTDLCVKMSLRDTSSGEAVQFTLQLNSTSPSSSKAVVGNGSAASSPAYYALSSGSTATANTFGSAELYIPNYTSTTNKSASLDFVTETNSTFGFDGLSAILFSVTTAVTAIKIIANGGNNFAQYSTAYLYGVKNA